MQGWRHHIWLRLKTMWKRRQLDRDLDDETAFHLAMREGQNRAAADIAGMVLRETLFLAAIALTLGLGCALILTRVLDTLLFEVTATDPATLLSVFCPVFCLVFCVSALAALLPASRAMRVDPTIALRHE